MSDSQLAASVLALLDGTVDTFLVCAGAGAVVSQKTAAQARTLLSVLPLSGGTMVGDLLFTDATYDIGKSGATRPRDGFFSRNVVIGGALALGVSSASNKLHVVSSSSSSSGLLVTGGSTYEGGASSGEIRLGHGADFGLISYGGGSGDLVLSNAYNANAGDIIFRTKTNGTAVTALTITGAGTATFVSSIACGATLCAGTYTVATLPSAAANAYKFATVSDSSVTTFGSTVAAGGSSKVMVFSNGTNWTVFAI